MNRDNGTESSFIAGLLRDVDLTASPLRLFVTGTDASARPQVTRVVRKRIESGDRPVVTAVTHDVPADAIVVIADAQALTSDEIRALKELVQRDDLGVVIASDRIDPPLAPIYSNISSFGTVLHLNPLNRNDIRKIAAERRVPLDDRAVVALEHLSGGSFGAIEAYFAAASAGRPEMPNAIRTHILHQVTALHPIEREILEVSLAVPDIDAFELDLGQEKFSLTAAFDPGTGDRTVRFAITTRRERARRVDEHRAYPQRADQNRRITRTHENPRYRHSTKTFRLRNPPPRSHGCTTRTPSRRARRRSRQISFAA